MKATTLRAGLDEIVESIDTMLRWLDLEEGYIKEELIDIQTRVGNLLYHIREASGKPASSANCRRCGGVCRRLKDRSLRT